MFTTAFSGGPKHVILVQSESYTAKNEVMICRRDGTPARRRLVPGRARRGRAAGRDRVFHSAYTFDHDREGAWLKQVLADL